MLDILKNFEDASAGKKPAAGAENANEMKAILESFNKVEECGMDEMPMQAPTASEGNPVTMSVNLSASGKDHVNDLVSLMRAAGLDGAAPLQSMQSQDVEMPDQEMDMATMRQIMAAGEKDGKLDLDVDNDNQPDLDTESWDNSPEGVEGEPEYRDHEYMIKDLSGGLNREKKSYKKAQDGDNAMAVEAIKDRLWAALHEKKSANGK